MRVIEVKSNVLHVFRNKETGEYVDEDFNPTEDIYEAIGYSKYEDAVKALEDFDEPDEWYIVLKVITESIIDEIVSIYKKMYREGLDTIMSGGREGGAKTPYIVTHLVSDGERYYVSEGELRIINDTAYTKTEGRKKWSTGGSNNGSSSSGSER